MPSRLPNAPDHPQIRRGTGTCPRAESAESAEMNQESLDLWLSVIAIVVAVAFSAAVAPKISRGYAVLSALARRLGNGASSIIRGTCRWLQAQDPWRLVGMAAVLAGVLYLGTIGWNWLPNATEWLKELQQNQIAWSLERRIAIQCGNDCNHAQVQFRLYECEDGAIKVAKRRSAIRSSPNLRAGAEHLRACLQSHGIATTACPSATHACVGFEGTDQNPVVHLYTHERRDGVGRISRRRNPTSGIAEASLEVGLRLRLIRPTTDCKAA